MRKTLLSIILASTALCAGAKQNYELRVLTFEDEDYKGDVNFAGGTDWSSLISDPQYGGPMLYGESGMGVSSIDEAYKWSDDNNTWLSNILSEGYGSWCYWSGGHAISNYGSSNVEAFGDFMSQLTVFNANAGDDITQSGNGHNGSNNFAMHFGYADNSGWGLGEEALPTLRFSDNTARVIDHLYVNNSTYALNCYVNGNSLTANIGPEDWVKIIATGYNGDEKTGTAEIFLCDGPENIIMDWTKFDLSVLGEVTKVTFNIAGSSDNGYGFSQPAYFAYDDVAVRFPLKNTISAGAYTITADVALADGVSETMVPEAFRKYLGTYTAKATLDGDENTLVITENSEAGLFNGFEVTGDAVSFSADKTIVLAGKTFTVRAAGSEEESGSLGITGENGRYVMEAADIYYNGRKVVTVSNINILDEATAAPAVKAMKSAAPSTRKYIGKNGVVIEKNGVKYNVGGQYMSNSDK